MFAAESLAACAVAALCAGGPTGLADSSLTLSLHSTDGTVRSVHLMCDPDLGTHPRAREACAALESANGDFTRLPVKHTACTMAYSPVRAQARGHWEGEPIEFTTEYPNRCFANAHSGGVFGF